MGQQQLLLIILGVIIVGVAVAVGISMFSTQSDEATKDQVVQDLNNICSNAYQYRIKPTSLGGGNGSYVPYVIPANLSADGNIKGSYAISGTAATGTITFKVTAPTIATAITASVDSTGAITVKGR